MKFPIKDFLSKCDQSRSFLRIWSHLLKKSLMENFIFCAVILVRMFWKYLIFYIWYLINIWYFPSLQVEKDTIISKTIGLHNLSCELTNMLRLGILLNLVNFKQFLKVHKLIVFFPVFLPKWQFHHCKSWNYLQPQNKPFS